MFVVNLNRLFLLIRSFTYPRKLACYAPSILRDNSVCISRLPSAIM